MLACDCSLWWVIWLCVTYLSVVKLSVHVNLTLRNVTRQIRDRMGDIYNTPTHYRIKVSNKWQVSSLSVEPKPMPFEKGMNNLKDMQYFHASISLAYRHWALLRWESVWLNHCAPLHGRLSRISWLNLCTCNQGNHDDQALPLWRLIPV